MAAPRSVVGAHLLCFINGRLVGEVTGIRWDSQSSHIERRGVDSLTAYGFEPIATKITGGISLVRLHGTGGLEGRGISAPFHHMPRQKYVSILVVDRVTGKRMYKADHCVVTGQSWNNAAKSRVEGQFTFEGIEWANELDV